MSILNVIDMKTLKKTPLLNYLFLLLFISACSSSGKLKDDISGKYASTGENNYDYFKDTMQVKSNDHGKFDIQIIAIWSAAKQDDPERPNKNKKAGVWNDYGSGDLEVATLQASDTTLRITEPMTGQVRIFKVNTDQKTIIQISADGTKKTYTKIPD
ncbi:hypothetical protein LY11_03427 [Pedobacter cryoconitis]|uniref:Uncharacterized protein n=2 Tax=Pedobacter cryoconitis TaxID=188932 RepID=A0A327SQX3_9SPHI|nr:hypothetical protein LY11_03427 [Pedobacter cryoconitis]